MAKEVLIYGDIHSFTASSFINEINDLSNDDELIVRINTDGGDPEFGFGMSAKFNEFQGKKKVKVDGKANSTGLFFITTAKDVEALDVSTFVIHRAAFPEFVEQSEALFTPAMKDRLNTLNKSLRRSFEAKIHIDEFEKMKDVKIKDIFSLDDRIDVVLTAKEAKKIGLINKIIPLTSDIEANISSNFKIAAKHVENETPILKEVAANTDNNKSIKPKTMTQAEFKNAHPEAYSAIVKEGVSQERDRAGAWATFIEVDPKAVAAGIKGGEALTQTAMSEFSMKMAAKATMTKVETDAAASTVTKVPETAKTEKEKISAEMDKALGINQKEA